MPDSTAHPGFLESIPREFAREHLVLGVAVVQLALQSGSGEQAPAVGAPSMRILHAPAPRTDPLILHNVATRLGHAVTFEPAEPESIARSIDEAYAARARDQQLGEPGTIRLDREDAPVIVLGADATGARGSVPGAMEADLQRLLESEAQGAGSAGSRDLLSLADKGPVIRLVDSILFDAIGRGASDIHIQPLADGALIRVRVDGVLLTARKVSPRLAPAIVSRIKVMARLDVAERRAPQDGRATVTIGGGRGTATDTRAIDLRIATLPTAYGERVVIRLLDTQHGRSLASLDAIGMPKTVALAYCDRAARSSGIVLVTGPTGSGKTTTLYATLRWIAQRHDSTSRAASEGTPLNILTIEDPIEYDLSSLNEEPKGTGHVAPGVSHENSSSSGSTPTLVARRSSLPVSQTQVDPRKGLTFATGLRHILRQDPDVIMVGEIRDLDTARIAIQASLTGHLVFSTLHTADAPGAITRLLDLGIEPYLVASSLSCVLAQRLVRLRHQPCSGAGCTDCLNSGFKGRRGIFELLSIDAHLREMISQRASGAALRDAAVARGMERLEDQGARLARADLTTLDEVRRVTLGAEG